jgi:glycosyltransferase involved in cell wall biosynthesis
LEKLATAEGFVYLPKGGDTCPRMVIEAKLLGCEMHLNDNVQHAKEEWFATDDLEAIHEYLYAARGLFWNGIKKMMDYRPTISGYTTTYNCVKQEYPFVQCIGSMLPFCDEVCVVDGGSTDGTWATLQELAAAEPRLKIKQVKRDWSSKRHPVFDGMQKAESRAMCTKEFCWQMDSDEIVHEEDGPKIVALCRGIPKDTNLLSLPVIEGWGGWDHIRIDVQPWKWRLSRNAPNLTHGIPAALRRTDADGQPYALPGTDGCDMIDKVTGDPIPHVSFYTPEVENVRRVAMLGNEQARQQYEQWFNQVVANLPGVFHYSWIDLPRKIRLYRDYWTRHWVQLAGGEYLDTADANMMFDVPWSRVTEEMIERRAEELKQIGGWIWHRKWDGSKNPWIKCVRRQPKMIQ